MRSTRWFLGLVVLASCAPRESSEPPPVAVVCAWDVSTSMRAALAEAGREVCVREVETLRRGSVSVRVIGAGSFANEAEAGRLVLMDGPECTNPFSSRCRRTRAHAASDAQARREDVIAHIRAYVPDRSVRAATDFEGFLAAAEDVFQATDTTWQRRVVLATDMVPSGEAKPVSIDLDGVAVDAWVQWPASASEGRRLRDAFDARMRNGGAGVITYHSLTAQES